MARMDSAWIERILENDYAQDQLRDGVRNLRAAYERASKRRVKASRDDRVRRQVTAAASSITEAAKAFSANRRKPKPRWGRRLLILGAVGGAAVGIALAARRKSPEWGAATEQQTAQNVPDSPATKDQPHAAVPEGA
jgi:hypothetical protein